MSINLSGTPYTGEGADFKLEAVNKNVQGALPARPSGEDWQRASANYHQLKILRESMLKDAKMSVDSHGLKSKQPIEDQVMAFRALLRKSGYLTHPEKERQHYNLSGKLKLNPELVQFSTVSSEKRCTFINSFVNHVAKDDASGGAVPYHEPALHITIEEEQSSTDISKKNCGKHQRTHQ
jgi:hypothetical protein